MKEKQVRVTIDGEKYYPCELILHEDGQPEYWNGFVCPLFSREVAEEVMSDNYKAWIIDRDGSLVGSFDGEFNEQTDRWGVYDNTGAYAIGAFAWVWQEEE